MAAALFAAVVAAAGPAAGEPHHYRARYDASLLGFPIGQAAFESRFDGARFEVTGSFASAGLARIFDRTEGSVTAKGALAPAAPKPERFSLDYRNGDKRQTTEIRFADGRVAATENDPPPKPRGDDWIAVAGAELRRAVDPLSAMLVRADAPDAVCGRTLRVYDGQTRVDFVLDAATGRDRLDAGAVTCRARFVPVSGYRKGRSAIAFLRDRARILVAFAPLGETGVYSPVEAAIGTEIGTVRVRARSITRVD
uniref:DUF3108 domain-containing protein n=1 Tax=Aquibium sp. A9E412 TaxID=2976767 RepID=UPI0025B05910|nr:DUF3108 domain-containing protein [Aquibium sp. A9E412]